MCCENLHLTVCLNYAQVWEIKHKNKAKQNKNKKQTNEQTNKQTKNQDTHIHHTDHNTWNYVRVDYCKEFSLNP